MTMAKKALILQKAFNFKLGMPCKDYSYKTAKSLLPELARLAVVNPTVLFHLALRVVLLKPYPEGASTRSDT